MNDQDFRLHPASRHGAMILNPTSHPAYAPVKLNVKTGNDIKVSKSKVPEKPIAPYMRYSKKVWDAVKAQHPDAKLWEIGKIIGAMWKDLNENEKQEYILEYENSKAEYCEQIKAYHNSPQYQSFLSNAPRKRGRDDVKQGGGNSALMSSNIINTLNNNNRVAGISETAVSHYAIEPAEDDGFDDSMSLRQLALQRYNRNHRLLNEVFNEYVVPDNRSMITSQRMEQLKKQVASLESHQGKLKDELTNIEEKHEARRKKMIDAANSFNSELEKLNKFKVDDEQLKTFYTKHYEQIEKSWEEHCERAIKAGNTNNENNPAAFKMSLEHLVVNNKALMTIPAPSCVSLVALQQIVETPTTPNVPASTSAVTPNPTQPSTANAVTPQAPQAAAAAQSSTIPASSTQPAASQAVASAQQPAAHGPYPNHQNGNPPGTQPNMYSHQQQQQQMMHHHQQQMMQQHQHGQHPHAPQGPHQHQPPHHGHTTPQPQPPSTATAASAAVAPPTPSGQSQTQPPHGTPPTIPPQGMPNAHPMPAQCTPNQASHLPGQNIPPAAATGEYQTYNQPGMPHQSYTTNPAYMQQQQQPPQNPAGAMYPGQPPMYQQQHQYGMQQPYGMQRPPGPFMGPQSAPNAPNQPPGQPMMPMNRAPAPNGQPNQPYPYMMNQPQFNQQQQFRSTNTPPTNPSANMASPVQPPSSSTPGATPAANPNAPQQSQINSTTPTPAAAIPNASQSPIVNRNQPAQQPGAQQVRQQQPGQVGPPNMNFYNGQMPMGQQPGQAHMYSMHQQQQHYQGHPNMMPQQQQPGQYSGQPSAQPVPTAAVGQANPQANSQYGGPTPQGQAPPPNMLYPNGPQHQGNMPYGHMPPNMTQQQVMMMQQQQHQMMNNQYGMYQGVPQQGQQPGMPPNVMGQQPQQPPPQQPQLNNSSPSQPQAAASPAPQQPESKAKDKKKKKKAKGSTTAATESS